VLLVADLKNSTSSSCSPLANAGLAGEEYRGIGQDLRAADVDEIDRGRHPEARRGVRAAGASGPDPIVVGEVRQEAQPRVCQPTPASRSRGSAHLGPTPPRRVAWGSRSAAPLVPAGMVPVLMKGRRKPRTETSRGSGAGSTINPKVAGRPEDLQPASGTCQGASASPAGRISGSRTAAPAPNVERGPPTAPRPLNTTQ